MHRRGLLQETIRRARQRAFARRVARWFGERRRLAQPLSPFVPLLPDAIRGPVAAADETEVELSSQK